MASAIVWVAGPIQYWRGDYTHFDLACDFIGGNADYQIRRWRVRYKAETRAFTASNTTSDQADQEHASALRALYLPISVRRRDLPKGPILVALKAMLPSDEIAAALRTSIARK